MLVAAVLVLTGAERTLHAADPRPSVGHGLSIYGALKYGPGFKHFDYVNPDASRGGDVRLAAIGTFDSLNPFVLKGVPAAGLGQVFETLTVASADEATAEYGLLAESVEMPDDRSWVAFTHYWGAKLPVRAGQNNFDTIRYDYYRDSTVALEAFKAGQYDFRQENSAKNWAAAYKVPAVTQGLLKKEEIPNEVPTGMQAFVFNTRRPIFQDRRVRQALGYAFDFEWANKNLFHGAYTRTRSYFSNSELASSGLPGPEEIKVLEPFRGRVPPEVFAKEYQPPVTDGSGDIRANLREALGLLKEAGWVVQGQKLANARTGEPMQFEILLDDPNFERITLPFVKNLERLGVAARVRTVDAAQYQKRVENFDFDMAVGLWGQSLSPGNEQTDFWNSERAGIAGSRNLAGIHDPVVDKLVELVISAPDRPSLVVRTRALDRVLLWGFYGIPHFHIRTFRVAYWDKFDRPRVSPKYALGFDTWWVDAKKEAALLRRKGEGSR